ncbi:hypothetical protein [Streptomyces sp. NPDC057257]|uniref:hypothetical protein n=1 Tax=Streptomyces sp. NPDC057257 TaxID=3346071 RepID=UPI0036323A62
MLVAHERPGDFLLQIGLVVNADDERADAVRRDDLLLLPADCARTLRPGWSGQVRPVVTRPG